jgi:hypothetical protein
MLIAQAIAEYGLLSGLADSLYTLRVRVEGAIGPPGLAWLGIGVAVFAVWRLLRR